MRVAAGAIARKWLRERYGVVDSRPPGAARCRTRFRSKAWEHVDANPFFVANDDDRAGARSVHGRAAQVGRFRAARASTSIATGVPVGWGEPVYDKLDADIAHAMMSINAVKGVEIGAGFAQRRAAGHRAFRRDDAAGLPVESTPAASSAASRPGRTSSSSIAVKPTSSIRLDRHSIDKAGAPVIVNTHGRHDPCVGIRATPIAEAMLALVLMDHALRHRAQNADVDLSRRRSIAAQAPADVDRQAQARRRGRRSRSGRGLKRPRGRFSRDRVRGDLAAGVAAREAQRRACRRWRACRASCTIAPLVVGDDRVAAVEHALRVQVRAGSARSASMRVARSRDALAPPRAASVRGAAPDRRAPAAAACAASRDSRCLHARGGVARRRPATAQPRARARSASAASVARAAARSAPPDGRGGATTRSMRCMRDSSARASARVPARRQRASALPAQRGAVRHDQRGGRRRRRRAHVGDEIADREIGLVADAGDDGDARLEHGARDDLLVERPQVLDRAAAAARRSARRLRRARWPCAIAARDLGGGAGALHRASDTG